MSFIIVNIKKEKFKTYEYVCNFYYINVFALKSLWIFYCRNDWDFLDWRKTIWKDGFVNFVVECRATLFLFHSNKHFLMIKYCMLKRHIVEMLLKVASGRGFCVTHATALWTTLHGILITISKQMVLRIIIIRSNI